MGDTLSIPGQLKIFAGGTGGFDSWLANPTAELVDALDNLASRPMTCAQINQLLTLAHEAPMSEGFFKYFWLSEPETPYNLRSLPGYAGAWATHSQIVSIDHFEWGMYRFYVHALLFFGNIRTAYRTLRQQSFEQINAFVISRSRARADFEDRGPALPLEHIAQDDRYLIAEMACKSFEPQDKSKSLMEVVRDAYHEHKRIGGGSIGIRELLSGEYVNKNYSDMREQLEFSADDILGDEIKSEQELDDTLARQISKFEKAREAAVINTSRYLSMVGELDAYVATSMRTRNDFRAMARFCDDVFQDDRLKPLHIRYFDPTLSAAKNHEDKGLIECLMVKCAKVLVYNQADKDSYGKDAEVAMALSLGKPVIFYCTLEHRRRIAQEIHPLSRLIDFQSGVAVGAMVTSSVDEVVTLLHRIYGGTMQYHLEQKAPGYLLLKEQLTGSIVRLQTNDALLRETFWNYYGNPQIGLGS